METLTQQALIKARTKIMEAFADPTSLDDLGVLSVQLEKQLQTAESQLNGTVQSKLDSLKRAVDLMDESAVKLSKLSANISRIDEKIAQTNTSISNYEYLKRVHNARENLSKVISQVEFFAKVPERVMYLRDLLEKSPSKLKEVFLESLKYESLRVALMKEIRVSRNRKMSIVGAAAMQKAQGGDYSEDTFRKVREVVEGHLRIVPELVKDVRQRVFDNIERMWDLAVNSPADLVTSFEIIEMQQEYNQRRNRVLDEQNIPISEDQYHEDIVATVKARIQLIFEQRVEGEFESMMTFGEKVSMVTSLIMAANQILQKMTVFREDVIPCVPPHYDAMLTYIEAFEAQLIPRIEQLGRISNTLKVAELLDVINWVEYHRICMEEFGFKERACIETFQALKMELVVEYKDKIKTQVAQWFQNIKNQPLEITRTTEGILITTHPEDMFNILHAQLEVAREKLPQEYVFEVSIACLQVLRTVQRESYDALSSQWKNLDPETMCATINDNQRMQEKCDEFGEYLFQFVEDGPEKDTLRYMLEEVSSEYIALAVKAVSCLAKCILEDLDDAFFSKLYTQDWEKGEGNFSGVLVATLNDYFQDLSEWLSEYFYSKLVKETFITVINYYVMGIRQKANGTYTFASEIMAANRVINDKTVIEEYFEQHADLLMKAGSGSKQPATAASVMSPVAHELEPLLNLARVVSTRHLSGAEGNVKDLFQRWGVDGLRVVQAAFLVNPSLNKVERQQQVENAKKMFDAGSYNTKPIEEFASFDSVLTTNATKEAAAKTKTGGGFWSRRK